MRMLKWEQEYRQLINGMTFPQLWKHFIEIASQPDYYDGDFTVRHAMRYEICLLALEKFLKDAGLLPAIHIVKKT